MTDELRECPFCGWKGINYVGPHRLCESCEATAKVERWNTRPAEDRLHDALLDVWRVLGPSVPKSLNCCQGCDHEWGEALRIIKAALPGEVLPYEKEADDG